MCDKGCQSVLRRFWSGVILQQLFRIEPVRQKLLNGPADAVFGFGRQTAGQSEVFHGRFGFIAAFPQDALRRNVTRQVVAAAADPETVRIEHAVQPQRVVDDHFTPQKHDRQIISEDPCLHRIVFHGCRQMPVTFCFGHHSAGQGAVDSREPCSGLPVFQRRQRSERKVDVFQTALQPRIHRLQSGFSVLWLPCQNPPHRLRTGPAMFGRQIGICGAPRIDIASAADRHQCHTAGMVGFNEVGRVSRPVSADTVVSTRAGGGMTGVVHHDCQKLSGGCVSGQNRQPPVNRTICRFAADDLSVFPHAPVAGEIGLSESCRQCCRFPCCNGRPHHVHQSVSEVPFVLNQTLPFRVRHIHQTQRRAAHDPGGRMRVRERHHEPLTFQRQKT